MEEKIMEYKPLDVENEILGFWNKNKTYEAAKNKNKGKQRYYFLDGPPYTSGTIHLGTAWNKSLKDCFLRYKRMQGLDVWDRAGYDMHGMPTELKVQAKLGMQHKEDILKFGVAKFVNECRAFCLTNLEKMNEDFKRLGTWMDYDNAYQSIKPEFMEGEWWLIKKAFENKRLYEGKKSLHWCSNCATALAKHELEYENVRDNSIFVKFKVRGTQNEYLIIWTTTPWTIPFNLGIMVHPDFDYVRASVNEEIWIVAKYLAAPVIQAVADKDFTVIEEFKGEKLKGMKYDHPFADMIGEYAKMEKLHPKVHTVVMSEEFVTLDAGSGLVHMAPGCGPEDFEVGHKEGIPPYNNLDEQGVFPDDMGKLSGLVAKKDDKKFTEELKNRNALIGQTTVEHEYAHCWRCKNPVIFRTTEQWFFKVEDLREKMKELNKSIRWQPDFAGSRQFNSWLDNLRDNGITRQRFWGTPLPIWKCDKCAHIEVIGSILELTQKAGKIPEDLHKPWIDEVKIKCKCGNSMSRIPDILDVWIDAGTTSWNCLDFPHRKDLFDALWPADFILEGKDQIRGWFNLLFVASMVSMGKPSFKSVYMHGFINDSQGRKMSKSMGNVISPYEVIDKYGADTFRYYAIGSAAPGMDMNYNGEDVKLKYKNLMVLWNLHKFLIDFTRPEAKAKESDVEEDYIISRLHSTIKKVTENFERFELNEVPLHVEEFFLELSRTYVQLVREKSALGEENEKALVLETIKECMIETLKLFSPIAPFVSEKMYQNIKKSFGLKEESIHHFSWPSYDEKKIRPELEADMEIAKDVIAKMLAAREKIQLGVKWPLKSATVAAEDDKTRKAVTRLAELIKSQTNVKELKVESEFKGIKYSIKPNFKTLGPEFGADAAKIIAHLSTKGADTVLEHISKDGFYLVDGNEIKIEHLLVEKKVPEHLFAADFGKGVVFIDKERDEKLEAEGYAREIMRKIQSLRKDAGLQRKDNISLHVVVDDALSKSIHEFSSAIKGKCGAKQFEIATAVPSGEFSSKSEEKIKGKDIKIFFNKA
jgi:isoleucyl-tRNA synthetase